MTIHPSINATGTKWTRHSGSDPNPQNFKKELSFLFGPPPGFYWLYMDVVNIELRIWAYETNCTHLIREFERGESVHMIIARVVRPHQIETAGSETAWKATDPEHKQYTRTKGGTFALTYGGGEAKINDTYGIPGAFDLIKSQLPGVIEYAQHLQAAANHSIPIWGYPTLYTRQGYPLQIPRTKPHKATSGRVQGAAGLIVQDMMRTIVSDPVYILSRAAMTMEVHDSITFQIPQHTHYEFTNSHIVSTIEAVGASHIPTCPMDPEVIWPNEDEPFLLKIPTILPENIGNYVVTYYYHDILGWVARARTQSDTAPPLQVNAPTQSEACNNIICKIEGTPF